MQKSQKDIFALPKEKQGRPLCYSIFEIGCKPDKKGSQLREMRQYFHYCYSKLGLGFQPDVFKIQVSYERPFIYTRDETFYSDHYIHIDKIPRAAFFWINRNEFLRKQKHRTLIEKLTKDQDSKRLHDFITSRDNNFSDLRGNLGEYIAQMIILNTLPSTSIPFFNGDLNGLKLNKRTCAEFDVVTAFYGHSPHYQHMVKIGSQGLAKVYECPKSL